MAASADDPDDPGGHVANLFGQLGREGRVGAAGNVDDGGDDAEVVTVPFRAEVIEDCAHGVVVGQHSGGKALDAMVSPPPQRVRP